MPTVITSLGHNYKVGDKLEITSTISTNFPTGVFCVISTKELVEEVHTLLVEQMPKQKKPKPYYKRFEKRWRQ